MSIINTLYFSTVVLSLISVAVFYNRKGYTTDQSEEVAEIIPFFIFISLVPIFNLFLIGGVLLEEFNIIKNKRVELKNKEKEINEFWECVHCDIRMRKGYIMTSKVEDECPICKKQSSFLKVEKSVVPSKNIVEHQYITLKDFEKNDLATELEEQERKYLEVMKEKLSNNEGNRY